MLKGIRDKLKWADPFTYVDKFVMPRVNPNGNKAIEWIVYIFFAFVFALLIFSFLGFVFGTGSPLVIVVSGSMEPTLHRGDVMLIQGVSPENINAETISLNENISGKPVNDYAEIDYKNERIIFTNGESIPLNKEGDIIVFYSNINNIQVIHRVVAKINAEDGYFLLTKGDNDSTNRKIDQDCGQIFGEQLNNSQLYNSGKAWFRINERSCLCARTPNSFQDIASACIACNEQTCNYLYAIPAESIDGKTIGGLPYIGYVKLFLFDDLPKYILSLFR